MRTNRLLPKKVLIWIGISVLGILIYSNTFGASFHLDDWRMIVENRVLRDLNLAELWGTFYTRFLTGLTFALNYHFHRLDVLGYHVVNLMLHLLNTFLVYRLACLLFETPVMKDHFLQAQKEVLGILSALLFLVHPIQTQAVTYIWQRAASLATLFYLLSVVLYVQGRCRAQRGYLVGAFITTCCAMFTKEIAFTLPLFLLVCEGSCFGPLHEDKGKRVLRLIPFLGTLFIIPIVLTQWAPPDLILFRREEVHDFTYLEYLFTQLNVLRTYVRLLFIPVRQNLDYDYPIAHHLFSGSTPFSCLLFIGMAVGTGILFRKERFLFLGAFWFFLALAVETGRRLSFVIFEHRLYLPMVGFALFVPFACARIVSLKATCGFPTLVCTPYSRNMRSTITSR